jgi:hypothetical protein
MLIRSDITYEPRLSNCWLPASTWVEALTKSNLIDVSLADVRKFSSAMSKSPFLFAEVMHQFDGSNTTGVFRIKFQKTFFYYFAEEIRQFWYPLHLNNAWKEKVMEAASNVLVIPNTRSHRAASITVTTAVDIGDTEEQDVEEESPKKHPRVGEDHIVGVADLTSGRQGGSYWPCSPEAYQPFKPKKICAQLNYKCEISGNDNFDSETSMKSVKMQILLLQSAHDREDNWRNVVLGCDNKNVCKKAEIWEIQQRATFLCFAYQLALTKMNEWTWQDCCTNACQLLNSFRMKQASFYKTVSNWNIAFRKYKSFPHPNLSVQCGKQPLPCLLEVYLCAKERLFCYASRIWSIY